LARNPRELLDEWTTGLDAGELMLQQMERELLRKLKDPSVRYLDYYTTSFDHVAHLSQDLKTKLPVLQSLDAVIGRLWNAIRNAPLAEHTALVLVSDHGMNTDERVYSQGYNLVRWLGETNGGAHQPWRL
jgi:membrane-anchored protein YejM (alkaline phosphatase superfamily)